MAAFNDHHRYQDIAIINVERPRDSDAGSRNRKPFLTILLGFLALALLIAVIGLVCIQTGVITPADPCCYGPLELDLDFDFAASL
ncbi:MAG: hypothetical protein ACX939_00455 [Hyphococcus sp.]